MKKYLVIGNPVAHSLSPAMQQAAFDACRLEAVYEKRRVTAEELPEFCLAARRELAGFNVTVPHKQAVIPFLDAITPEAKAAGSVNTVITGPDGRLSGDSTDGFGLAAALEENFHRPATGQSIILLGAGGAARAAAFALARRGVREIRIVNRTAEHAEALAAQLKSAFPELRCAALTGGLPSEAACDLLIQATSLGLRGDDPLPCPETWLTRGRRFCCFDMVYRKTAFQRRAAEAGLPTANGLEMLLHQGARSFELWTGKTAPLTAMRRALYRAADVN